MKKRTITCFFTPKDEEILSQAIRSRFPSARFIDDQRWPTETPPTFESIHLCSSLLSYIWNPDIFPTLPTARAPDGRVQGPATYHVIQFSRSRMLDGVLRHGQFSMLIDPDHDDQRRFCESVSRIIRKQRAGALDAIHTDTGRIVSTGITNFVTGADAYKLATDSEFLSYAGHHYVPTS